MKTDYTSINKSFKKDWLDTQGGKPQFQPIMTKCKDINDKEGNFKRSRGKKSPSPTKACDSDWHWTYQQNRIQGPNGVKQSDKTIPEAIQNHNSR